MYEKIAPSQLYISIVAFTSKALAAKGFALTLTQMFCVRLVGLTDRARGFSMR